jgi:hypothetical protein
MLTAENIEWQFIDYPTFKEAVYKKYPDGLVPENWEERVVALLKDYGYTFEITNPYKSKKYNCIVEVELSRNGEWMSGLQTHERGAIEQAILSALSDDEIIFD